MIEILSRHALKILIGLCALLALLGLFFRAESGPEALPLMYPLLATVAVLVVVLLVRLLSRVLESNHGDHDAD
jgi:uncharacterized membrane protein